jgi:O-antigen/teichoic acid export membrane protein
MQKKFLKNLGLLLLLNLLIKPFWVLGIDRSVQNAVGSEEFGFYFSILNFSFLFSILLDFGITNFNNRNIAQNSQLLNKHFSSILILKILLLVVYVIFTFGVGLIIGYNSSQFKMLGWIAVNQFLMSFVLYLRSNVSGLLLFKTDSFLSVLDRLLMILFCSVLLWGNLTSEKFQIEWFVYSQTAAYGFTAVIAFLVVVKKASFRRLTWNWPFTLMILKKSIPFAILALLMVIYYRIDAVLIERLLPENTGETQAGIYAQAYRLLDAAGMIAFLFAILLLPLFARMLKQKQSVESLVKLSFSLLFTVSVIVALGSFYYSKELMTWLYPIHADEVIIRYSARLDQSALIFSLLMFSFIAISSSYIFGTLLTANGNMRQLNIIAGSSVLVSLIINFLLIPRLQSVGSAYASLGSQYVTGIVQIIVVQRIFMFRINYRYIAVLFVFIAGVIFAGIISKQLPFPWKINFIVMLTGSGLLILPLRLIRIRELIRILRSEQE